MREPRERVLLIDVGNSRLKVRPLGGQETVSWPTDAPPDPQTILGGEVTGVVLASVVPRLTELIRTAVRGRSIPLCEVSPNVAEGMGIRGLYEGLGADRVANILGAWAEYRLPALCVDAGTAITFDLLEEGGTYAGGLIAPGPALMVKGLVNGTALIRLEGSPAPSILRVARGTAEAVGSATWWGAAAMVDGLIARLRSGGYAWETLLLTGGMAPWLSPRISWRHELVGDLCFRGMALVWERRGGGAHAR